MILRIIIGNQRHAKFVNSLMNLVASFVDGLADFVAGFIERLANLVAGLGECTPGFPTGIARNPASGLAVMHAAFASPAPGRLGRPRRGEWCDATIHDTTISRTIRRKNRFIVVQSHSG